VFGLAACRHPKARKNMRQRWGAAVWRAQTQVLLGRPKCALPGWEEAESHRAADSGLGDGGQLEATRQWLPVGLATAGGLAEIAAGVMGTTATWIASTGSRAAGREAQTPRLVGACEGQARVVLVFTCAPGGPGSGLRLGRKRFLCQLPLWFYIYLEGALRWPVVKAAPTRDQNLSRISLLSHG
jgi:hypothetical protein